MINNKKSFEELSDEELNHLKLVAEIKSLNKPFYLEPGFWTLIIAVTATIYSSASGLFETKSEIVKLETIKLENRRDSLKKEKVELIDSITKLKGKINSLNNRNNELKAYFKENNEKFLREEKYIITSNEHKIKNITERQKEKEKLLFVLSSLTSAIQEYYIQLNLNSAMDSQRRLNSSQNNDKNEDSLNNVMIKTDKVVSHLYELKLKQYLPLAIDCRKRILQLYPELKKNHTFEYSSINYNVDEITKVINDLKSLYRSLK